MTVHGSVGHRRCRTDPHMGRSSGGRPSDRAGLDRLHMHRIAAAIVVSTASWSPVMAAATSADYTQTHVPAGRSRLSVGSGVRQTELIFDLERSLSVLDRDGKSALELAEEHGHQEIARILRDHLQAIIESQTEAMAGAVRTSRGTICSAGSPGAPWASTNGPRPNFCVPTSSSSRCRRTGGGGLCDVEARAGRPGAVGGLRPGDSRPDRCETRLRSAFRRSARARRTSYWNVSSVASSTLR